MHPGFHLGITGGNGVKEESDGRGEHVLGVEENRGELQVVRGRAMEEYSLRHHMKRTHGIVLPQNQGIDVGGGVAETYVVHFTRVLKLVACLVDR